MVDIASFRFPDVAARFDRGYERGQRFRQDAAARTAGNYLSMGRPQLAERALYGEGMIAEGQAVADREAKRMADEQKAQDARATKVMEFTKEAAGRLANVYRKYKDVNRTLAAFDLLAPLFRQLGETPEEIAQVRQAIAGDPETALLALGAGAEQALKYEIRNAGEEVFVIDPHTGQMVSRYRGARTVNVPEGGALYEIPGLYGDGAEAQPTEAAADPDWLDAVAQAAGDARVTSGYRDPEHNARVGGVPNSRHLTGEAVDLVPRPGETMAQLHQRVRRAPGVRAINEGDHVHVQREGGARPAAQGQGGPRLIVERPKPQKPGYRLITEEEKKAFGLAADGVYQIGPDNQISRVSEPKSERPPTESQINAASLAYAAFAGNERMNELARRGIYKPATATDSLFNIDKKGRVIGVIARTEQDRMFIQAAKEFLAPILRKDTGAAVTDSELAYYMDTYIPRFEDSPQVLWQKAQARAAALRRIYGAGRRAYDQEYGPPGKWEVLTDPRGSPQSRKQAQARRPAAPRVGEVRKGYRFKGGDPAKPSSWERVR